MLGMLVGVGVQAISGLFGASSAASAQRAAQARANDLNAKLDALEKNRQAIINPYAATKDLSAMAKDLSGNINNAYANIGVATQAAEMQAEEADMSLANTLDALRSTGASAGGATALAQAALKSKNQVSASIESQEAANEKLKAQGQTDVDRLKMAEAQRIQGIQMSQAEKMENATNAAAQFKYAETEKREMGAMDRIQAQLTGAQNQANAAGAAKESAYANMFSGIGSAVTAGFNNMSAEKIAGINKGK